MVSGHQVQDGSNQGQGQDPIFKVISGDSGERCRRGRIRFSERRKNRHLAIEVETNNTRFSVLTNVTCNV